MQIIKAGYEVFPFVDGSDTLKKIEKVARVCYKSEDKIAEGSARKMVKALINRKHYAMLEHGSIIFAVDQSVYEDTRFVLSFLREKCGEVPFLRLTSAMYSGRYLISGNIRAWLEFLEMCVTAGVGVNEVFYENLCTEEKAFRYSPIFEDLKIKIEDNGEIIYKTGGKCKELFVADLTDKERLIHADLTVKFIVDRGVSHEIVRHRVASFAQESTRYCNYGTKGGEITVIEPFYLMADGVNVSTDNWSERYGAWVSACEEAEKSYLRMIADGASPQEARAVLPTSLKTEVVMTANLREWRHFFSLRACGSTGKPHPQMLEVAVPLLKEVKELIPVVFDDLEPMEV